jgi:hypothetical protein
MVIPQLLLQADMLVVAVHPDSDITESSGNVIVVSTNLNVLTYYAKKTCNSRTHMYRVSGRFHASYSDTSRESERTRLGVFNPHSIRLGSGYMVSE